MKKFGRAQWRIFITEVQETMFYSDEEISALLDYYYNTRKEKELEK